MSDKLAQMTKQRQEMMADVARQKEAIAKDSAKNPTAADRFVGKTSNVEDTLKSSTYGLVQLQEFKEKREQLEERARLESVAGVKQAKAAKKKKKRTGANMLSFDVDEEAPVKKVKLLKNTNVATHFLPDREREEAERLARETLRKEWLEKQEKVKQEEIEITYSYWDGSGHRSVVTCAKGDTIAQFLEKCRRQFPDLRAISIDNLMYIKEDLIIPHHYTFYDFIINKYRGKSGPMFSFDVHDDVRLISDATVEKDESHAGKVCERSWYNRNKREWLGKARDGKGEEGDTGARAQASDE